MKKVLNIDFQLVNTEFVFCYGQKAYSKFNKKRFDSIEQILKGGITSSWRDENKFIIVIGVKEYDDIYCLKGLIMHEISHAVTMLFNEYGFSCDEMRSYTIQWLYQQIMPFVDDIILKDKNDS